MFLPAVRFRCQSFPAASFVVRKRSVWQPIEIKIFKLVGPNKVKLVLLEAQARRRLLIVVSVLSWCSAESN
jgi:hypothetical protein